MLWLILSSLFVAVIGFACWVSLTRPVPIDFVSFWAAGRLAFSGDPAAAYDIAAHLAVEQTVVDVGGLIPFPYPPPFLLLVTPFGAMPYGVAFASWLAVTGVLYVLAARHFTSARIAIAQPAFVANGLIGQNGFLTSAIFLAGFKALATRPLLAGAILGCLVIKPQLGLMIPVALVASRNWAALGAALASAALLLLIAFVALGPTVYSGFMALPMEFARFLADGRWSWNEVASLFATARYFGLDQTTAGAIHAVVAAGAAVMVWRAWRSGSAGKEPLLAAATMLASPYLMTYDGVFLLLPFCWLLQGRSPYLAAVIWLLALLPVSGSFGLYQGPNTMWVAAILALIAISAERRGRSSFWTPEAGNR